MAGVADSQGKRRVSLLDRAQSLGFVIVALTMIEMFTIPSQYFVEGSIVSTSCMVCVGVMLTRYRSLFNPSFKTVIIGVLSAVLLYLVFFGGNYALQHFAPSSLNAVSNESSIYSLIGGNPPSIRLVVLILDAWGFESYFRGDLMNYFRDKLGIAAPFLSALIDAGITIVTLNPVFVLTTFIADSAWGLTYYYTKDLSAGILSHLLWDIAIFIVIPIR